MRSNGVFCFVMSLEPRDPDYERRVRASFGRQAVMATLGVIIDRISPGEVALTLPFRADLTQQHGLLHAGIVTSVLDSACGYAALSLMEPGAGVLSVEFKVNLLAPARADRFNAVGRVVRAGRTITVTFGELWALDGGHADREREVAAPRQPGARQLVAVMTGTMMTVRDRPGVSD
jgi:uncharacterized protein (TIGR00369 family)